ncbi:uncharacterized protein LOC141601824 [Silene latifolia]|uniref:uncharacterized protein LOC141601824 n=1 Tax=Silene latifolia TaxID=37657 RepID=UPI003D76EF86
MQLSQWSLALRFEKGLALMIMEKLPAGVISNLKDVNERARHAERLVDMAKEAKEKGIEKRKAESEGGNQSSHKRGNHNQARTYSGGSSYGGGSHAWGRDGRSISDNLNLLCFNCGGSGHKRYEFTSANGKVIVYASRQLKPYEENYLTHNLELGAVRFAPKIWRHYLYGVTCKVFSNHKSLTYIYPQKELNMRQRRWMELIGDYDMEIVYHEEKANVVYSLCTAMSLVKLKEEMNKRGIHMIRKGDIISDLTIEPEHYDDIKRKQELDPKIYEWKTRVGMAHCTPYSVHPGGDKLYKDLKKTFWWPGMKNDVAEFVARCLTCQRVKGEQWRPQGKIQSLEVPEWKWESIFMDLIVGKHVVRLHGVPKDIVSDRDTSYYTDIGMEPFMALYGRKCTSLVCWDDCVETVLFGPQMVQDMVEQMQLIRQKMKPAQDRQKSYTDLHRRDIEFVVGDKVYHYSNHFYKT